MTWRPSRLW